MNISGGDLSDVIVLESFRKAMPTHFIFKIQSFSLFVKNSLEKYESNTFEAAGFKWKLSLYPSGNKNENGKDNISLYLVMVDSTSLAAGWELKVAFSLFLFDQIRDRYLIRGEKEEEQQDKEEQVAVEVEGGEGGEGGGLIFRETLPTHFSFKIKSFSLLAADRYVENFESNHFKAGGYKWKLLIYPNGNRNDGGEDHISLYLVMADNTKSLPPAWEVNANFRFFLFDQIRDKYLILGDSGGATRRFHGMKTQWGISKLLPLTSLNDSSNGYLVDDTCVFGAEVLVCKSTGSGDVLSMITAPLTFTQKWRVKNFSRILCLTFSDRFSIGGYKWRILAYPKGVGDGKNNSVSLFLGIANPAPGKTLCVGYTLRLRNQISNRHHEQQHTSWLRYSDHSSLGFDKFISLNKLNDKNNGFLVKDTCIFEVDITIKGVLQKL